LIFAGMARAVGKSSLGVAVVQAAVMPNLVTILLVATIPELHALLFPRLTVVEDGDWSTKSCSKVTNHR
jgi:hypothetical protein